MRDPKELPHPGDIFRTRIGAEFHVIEALVSVTKDGRETPCLYVDRIVRGAAKRMGLSLLAFRSHMRSADIVSKGDDNNPWPNARRVPASEVFAVGQRKQGTRRFGPGDQKS
jgi:hypothetical protein